MLYEVITFSPEIFVRIEGGKISSYPMKGTIDANIPNAAKRPVPVFLLICNRGRDNIDPTRAKT